MTKSPKDMKWIATMLMCPHKWGVPKKVRVVDPDGVKKPYDGTHYVCEICGTNRVQREDGSCQDCSRPYGSGGFPDLIIPYWAWKRISPTGDDGGLLCPSCICSRLHIEGITCEGAFMSGPIESVTRPTMQALRRVENIELAIEGRNNAWAGVCELIQPNGDRADDSPGSTEGLLIGTP